MFYLFSDCSHSFHLSHNCSSCFKMFVVFLVDVAKIIYEMSEKQYQIVCDVVVGMTPKGICSA